MDDCKSSSGVFGAANGLSNHQQHLPPDCFVQNSPPSSSQALESLWVAHNSPTFHEPSSSMIYLEPDPLPSRSRRRIRRRAMNHNVEAEDDEVDNDEVEEEENSDEGKAFPMVAAPAGSVGGGRKRRLSSEQVKYLEKSFEEDNKLEPDRKARLALDIGLEPRQVAIWFQNRRARFKNKQLERDFDGLKTSYDKLRLDYDSLLEERENLKQEVCILTDKLKQRELEGDQNPSKSITTHLKRLKPTDFETHLVVSAEAACKQEEAASSAKSDVLDSESPHSNGPGPGPCLCPCPAEEDNYLYSSAAAMETSTSADHHHQQIMLPDISHQQIMLSEFHPQLQGSTTTATTYSSSDYFGLVDQPPPPSFWPWFY